MSKFHFDRKAARFRAGLPALAQAIGEIGVAESMRAFDNEAWNGKKWEKPKIATGHKLLQKTGRMKNSVRVLEANRYRVRWGATVPYAQYHNNGTKNLPIRRFVGFTAGVRRRMQLTTSKFIRNSMKQA